MSAPSFADLITQGARQLKEAGIEDPRREARLLMTLASQMSATALIAREPDPADSEATERFQTMLSQRARHVPFAHIAGRASFYGLDLICDDRALVPRADSECVVERALVLTESLNTGRIADLGTGSGCLLAAFLSQRPGWRGEGVEASPQAASLARENIDQLGFQDRASITRLSWIDWTGWGDVDLILSNPPYIRSDVIGTLDRTVRDYDPRTALDGGADGLAAYRSVIGHAAALRPGGWIIFEIGFDQAAAVKGLLSDAGFDDVAVGQDLSGHDRVISARQPMQ